MKAGEVRAVSLTESPPGGKAQLIGGAEQIFFETANVKVFESLPAKDAFYKRWFGHYHRAQPQAFLLALDGNNAVIGYLAGCLDSFSQAARPIVEAIPFYTAAFAASVKSYPSHFHINVKPGWQGRGVGRLLVAHFIRQCRESGSAGIHVVTGTGSRAVKFYEACEFERIAVPGADPGLAVLVYRMGRPEPLHGHDRA